jgi:polysaccharide pyruvyl transferase WcaK-like protein
MIIELAVDHFRKPVFYLNAMMSDCTVHGRNEETARIAINSLMKCQHVALRDHQSLDLASAISNGLKCSYVPDALFSWFDCFQNIQQHLPYNGAFILPFPKKEELYGKLDFHEPYICVGGSSLAARNISSAIPAYCALVEHLRWLGINIYLVQTCDGDHFLHKVSIRTGVPIIPVHVPILTGGAILANARLFVSGRFHPSILSSLGGTPCLFLGSNSHKTRSLQEVLEYDAVREWPAIPSKEDCYEILCMAHKVLEAGEVLRARIKSVSKKRSIETKKLLEIIQNGCIHLDKLISASAVYNGIYEDKRSKLDI